MNGISPVCIATYDLVGHELFQREMPECFYLDCMSGWVGGAGGAAAAAVCVWRSKPPMQAGNKGIGCGTAGPLHSFVYK